MGHLIFRELTEADRSWISSCRDVRKSPFTALSFPSLYTWRREYGLTAAGDEDFFVISSRHDKAFYSPCGDPSKCRAFIDHLRRTESHPHVLYLTQAQAEELEAEGWNIRFRPDLSEYIASTPALAMTGGHVSASFRKKINHFLRDYPYEVQVLTRSELSLLTSLSETLAIHGDIAGMGDLPILTEVLDSFEWLEMRGLLIRTQTGRQAFIIGYENMPGMFTMTISKHDPELPPMVTAVCVHELARMLSDDYPLINLEEDLGINGLRTSKQLYSPVEMLSVYEAFL